MTPGKESEIRVRKVAGTDASQTMAREERQSGPTGATRIYGPQKGVEPGAIGQHEARLARLAELVARDVADVSPDTSGAGAAGGLGFGLMAFCGAELRPGFDLVAEVLHDRAGTHVRFVGVDTPRGHRGAAAAPVAATPAP